MRRTRRGLASPGWTCSDLPRTLWPLVRQTDFAFVEHVRRDVAYGWLWLQAATPLFALATTAGLGAAALAWRLAHPRAGQR